MVGILSEAALDSHVEPWKIGTQAALLKPPPRGIPSAAALPAASMSETPAAKLNNTFCM
jgi:hypothetical protein